MDQTPLHLRMATLETQADTNQQAILALGARIDSIAAQQSAPSAEPLAEENRQLIQTLITRIDSVAALPQAPTTSSLLGDLDNDQDVDFSDFLLFAQNFGRKE